MKKTQWLAALLVVALGVAGMLHSHQQTAKAPEKAEAASGAEPGPANSRPATPEDSPRNPSALSEDDLAKLDQYESWLEDNLLLLQGMTLLERQTALWEKRQALFGEEASRIWGEEPSPMNDNQEALQAELQRLDKARDITPEEAAHQLKTTVEQLYDNDMARQLIGPDVMARTLFSLDAVQGHLKDLPPDVRQERINQLRQQMGYPEDAVRRMEANDQQRNERWEKGEAYMSEREQLTQRYSGDQLDQALDELRKDHFGRSARTISLEERDDFFRFERTRRYGVN